MCKSDAPEKTDAAPALEALPANRYIRATIVCSIAIGLAFLFLWLTADSSTPSESLFNANPVNSLYITVAVAFLINWIAFIPAAIKQTEKFFDLTGSITYFSCTLISLLIGARTSDSRFSFSTRAIIQSVFTLIWAARLGTFLYKRISKDSKDKRFDQIKINPPRFFSVWTIQGTWVTLTAISVFVVNSYGATDTKPIGPVDIIGYTIWLAGFGIEVVSDNQKSAFAANPANKGKWIEEGLWYYSRHPNYFGEITLWLGQFVAACSTFTGSQWACVVSPLFVLFLLMKVSGVPLLETRADAKWGTDPAYLLYKKNTHVLLILPKGKNTLENIESPLVESKV
eukprot:CAMPEP_0118661708 /NCGR_PEP_ID=MMETSP0785-20121206/16436_1 /TAXON_ID=91992 /ORGANISM="Bolidomonas pacifica, Strain CCMP 1866" /LENGTH=340 /DNA_ID=CAMNT_0006555191 /DNA_START=6 /DNA_END=1028 /DNA_ORIENTATION=+